MLIEAKYKDDKIIATHGYDPGPLMAYNQEMRKDSSNGWSKGKNLRHIARVDAEALDDYGKKHPEWLQRMNYSKDINVQRRAFVEFCNAQEKVSDEAYLNVSKNTII